MVSLPTTTDDLLGALAGAAADPAPIVVLRHSIREPIRRATISAAMEAPLTEAGREAALRLGRRLAQGRAARIYHSPVSRCEETARLLGQGLEAAGEEVSWAGADELLGALFMRDPERAMERFVDLGQDGFIRAWVGGELSPRIIDPFAVAGEALLAGLVARRAASPGAMQLHVTHDLTLVTLLGRAFAVAAPDFGWPGFLEGCVLHVEPGLLLAYQGQQRELASLSV